MRRSSKLSKSLFGIFSTPLLFLGLTIAAHAGSQPNPYKFPAAKGVNIPITEGYWATSQDACAKLELTDEKRPHVGLKGLAIAHSDSLPTYTFQYFGPRLGNWPDGLCYVRLITRDSASRYLANGDCGDHPSDRRNDRFSGVVVVHTERHITITLAGRGGTQDGTRDYFFCKSVIGPAR
jgi:hypothetical protein